MTDPITIAFALITVIILLAFALRKVSPDAAEIAHSASSAFSFGLVLVVVLAVVAGCATVFKPPF